MELSYDYIKSCKRNTRESVTNVTVIVFKKDSSLKFSKNKNIKNIPDIVLTRLQL